MNWAYQTFSFGDIRLHIACRAGPQPACGKTLTILADQDESETVQNSDALGLDVWPASLALAHHLAEHYKGYSGKCLELGAGTGIPGVLMAVIGTSAIVLTDYETSALALLQKTVRVNCLTDACIMQQLDWSSVACWDQQLRHAFDLVLASDVLYTSQAARPCAEALDFLLTDRGKALVAHQVRHAIYFDKASMKIVKETDDRPLELFKAACAGRRLHIVNVPLPLDSRSVANGDGVDELLLLTITRMTPDER